jgi:hypothetical protein
METLKAYRGERKQTKKLPVKQCAAAARRWTSSQKEFRTEWVF